MKDSEITKINTLRRQGIGYIKIAKQLNLPVNSVKSYCFRHPLEGGTCLHCSKPILQTKGKRERKYCSNVCRTRWWNANRYEQKRASSILHVCPQCGVSFPGYGNRTYCSIQCYAAARRKQDG